jgi:predicted MFS family arabinose efflux permease
VTFPQALRQRRFWVMVAAFFFANGAAVGIVSYLVPYLTGRGFTLRWASVMVSGFAAASIIGRVATGAMMDRIRASTLAFVVLGCAAASTAALAVTDLHLALLLFLVFVIGFGTGAEVDFLSYLMPKYFGYRALGKIYAGGYVLFNAGAALMPVLFGRVFDRQHSYELIFMLGGAAWLAGALLLLSLGPYPTWPDSARTAPDQSDVSGAPMAVPVASSQSH